MEERKEDSSIVLEREREREREEMSAESLETGDVTVTGPGIPVNGQVYNGFYNGST